MRILGLGFALAVLATGSPSVAQPAADYSPDDFVRAILSGPLPCPKGRSLESCEANPKTRRFTLATPPSVKRAEEATPVAKAAKRRPQRVARASARPAKLSSADVLVTFASGSAEITPQGQANLRSIAEGLKKPALAELTFEVAGFTDVTGSSQFNQTLSQRRAAAVRAYLVSLGVAEDRLSPAGYGPDHLIDPEDPTSEANRRVELHRLN